MEFQITLDDEGKVIDQLAVEIRSMAEDMKQKVEDMKQKMADVEECGKAERQAIKGQLLNEIQKVYFLQSMAVPHDQVCMPL